MALYDENNGVTDDIIKDGAIDLNKSLEGRCRFCARGFERGEQIVFGMIKTIQMKWLEADIEKAEPAGFGEEHGLILINAHLDCALTNRDQFRSITKPRKLV